MVTVACVLKSGKFYSEEWVRALGNGVRRWLPDAEFVCLTDELVAAEYARRLPLRHDWPGWWAKMCMFQPGVLSGRVVYFDLDTLLVGPLDEIAAYRGGMAMLSDFYKPRLAQSGVLAFDADSEQVRRAWDAWIENPIGNMAYYRGDGEFLRATLDDGNDRVDRLLDLFPGQICSYKVHATQGPPSGTRVVCAHGTPKFHQPEAGWAYELWTEMATS